MGKMTLGTNKEEVLTTNGFVQPQPRIIEKAVISEKLVEVKVPYIVEKIKEIDITKDIIKNLENGLLLKIMVIGFMLNSTLMLILLFK